jgi:hypothetical protein
MPWRVPVKTWLARLALVVTMAALAATSPRSWRLDGTVRGPRAAPGPDRIVRVRIEGTGNPYVVYRSRTGDTKNLDVATTTTADPVERTALLPPGATVQAVETSGTCRVGLGGCVGCNDGCPPSGAFVRASGEIVAAWSKTAEAEVPLAIPAQPEGKTRVPARIEAVIEPAVPDAEVVLRGKGPGDALRKWDGKPRALLCVRQPAGQMTCRFYYFALDPAGPRDVTVVVEAVRYGVCPGAGPCAPPPGTELRIVSVAVAF